MNNYFIDLNVISYKNNLYTDCSNLERIEYLFGRKKINLIVPNVVKVSEVNLANYKKIELNVLEVNQGFFKDLIKKRRIIRSSKDNFLLMTGNLFFLNSLLSFVISFKRFKLIYIGSISNSYYFSENTIILKTKYLFSLFLEFFSFLIATRIYSAGGGLPNTFFYYLFRKNTRRFNTKYFKNFDKNEPDYQEKFESNTVVFIGLVSSQKGMNENIRFIKKINSISENKYKLIIIGKKINNEYEKFLESENVEYKGYISDPNKIIDILNKSKFLILLSKHEGMARTPLEAMNNFLPVLTNGVGTLNYCNSENSIIDKNPESLALLAHKLSFEKYCEMSKSAFNTTKKFNGNESPIIR